MNSALYLNQAEFGILILSVPLKMITDSDCFLNQMVENLGEIGARPLNLRILKVVLPVTKQTCDSLRITPLRERIRPFLPSLNLILHVAKCQF